MLSGPALAAGAGEDGTCGPTPAAPAPPAVDVETHLFLVGDAGKPAPRGEPVLEALTRELARDPSRSLVVFLGDNIYPHGLPPVASPERAKAERRLSAQIAGVRASGARAIFIPGNHDWAGGGAEGGEAVRRQGAFLEERGAPLASLLPVAGCPGPAITDVGPKLRLVLLDTQWWLEEEPRHPTTGCSAGSEQEVLAALRDALGSAGERNVAVLAHHPLAAGGPHGGQFGWADNVFPLRTVKPWLWIPLPGLGSIYPLARKEGISPQDFSNERNRHMRAALEGVLREHPPLVYASGHEHSLQVLRGGSARNLLVSGGGILGHTDRAVCLPTSRFALGRAGFMRLDVEGGGRVRLGVLEVDARKGAAERFSAWLE